MSPFHVPSGPASPLMMLVPEPPRMTSLPLPALMVVVPPRRRTASPGRGSGCRDQAAAAAGLDPVLRAGAAVEDVVARAAVDLVVAAAGGDRVAARPGVERVVAAAAGDRIDFTTTGQ